MDNKPNLSREVKLQWAGSRERLSTPVEAEFFLDIPFYRTHGPDCEHDLRCTTAIFGRKRLEFRGIVIWRIVDRKIVERWAYLEPPHPASR
jgi:hypothetical protein